MAGIRSGAGAERPVRVMLLAGVVAPLVAWGLSIPAMLTWPGYDPVAQSISLLANAPDGWLQTLAFLVSGVLGLAWAVGMAQVLGATPGDRRRVRLFIAAQSSLAIAFALFPTDAEGLAVSLVGRLHLVTFGLYAVTMPSTLLRLAGIMARDQQWRTAVAPTRLAGVVMLAAILVVPVCLYGPLRPWLGVLERVYVAIPSAWEAAVSVAALRRLRRVPVPR